MRFGKILIRAIVLGRVQRLLLPQTFFVVLGAVDDLLIMHLRSSALRGDLTYAIRRTGLKVAVIGR